MVWSRSGCPLVGVTSLDCSPTLSGLAGGCGTVVSAVDGRRGEVFAQAFRVGDEVVALAAPEVTTARSVVILWATSGTPVIFTGDGVERYLGGLRRGTQRRRLLPGVPSVAAALALGERREANEHVVPLYLREADAVANFSTRERPHE